MASEAPIFEGPRGARPSEFGEVLDFLNFVFRSNVGRRPSMGGDYPHLYRQPNANNLRHIRMDGRIVSCVAIYPCRVAWGDAMLKVGGIGGVATDPDQRRHGLAGRVLEDCLRLMAEEDYDLSILWTGIGDYYRRWGWEDAGQSWSFSINRTTINYLPFAPSGEILTDTGDPRAIDGVRQLHDEMRRGVARDRELTEIMLNIPTRHRFAMLLIDDRPVAYVVFSYGQHADIKDYGGDPTAVLGLARIVFGRLGAQGVSIATPNERTGVAALLMERGFPAQVRSMGMLALINPERILRTYGVNDLPLRRAADGWTITLGGREVFMRPSDFVKFLFGPERPPGLDHPMLPLPFYYGQLDHM